MKRVKELTSTRSTLGPKVRKRKKETTSGIVLMKTGKISSLSAVITEIRLSMASYYIIIHRDEH